MIKTKTYKKFNGDSASVTFRLDKHLVDTNNEWWSILQVARNGVSTQNKWGGFPTVNTGSPTYINRKWNIIA